MRNFDEHILTIIDLLEYDMWLISPDKHIDCVCKNFETKQAFKFCPRCLGTGHKIKIKKIKGVRQPGGELSLGMGVTTENGIYFFKHDYGIKDDDLIVWHNEIEQVTKTERFCSDAQKPVYFRCETRLKKDNNEAFLFNFYKAIGKHWTRKDRR